MTMARQRAYNDAAELVYVIGHVGSGLPGRMRHELRGESLSLDCWSHSPAAPGAVQIPDPEAAAAVLLASLAYYSIVRLLIDHTPGSVDRERYLAAWLRQGRRCSGKPRAGPGRARAATALPRDHAPSHGSCPRTTVCPRVSDHDSEVP